jgi:threonylcarbamoyladenosine tRNA methylthiotransferase MtaB
MKFAIMSLGCRLNMAEIQSVSTELQEAGHEPAGRGEAHIHIINSCGVTTGSERKTRQLLYQSLRETAGNPDARIIVTGCAAGTERREDNVYYISNDYKHLIPSLVNDWSLFDTIRTREPSRFAFRAATKSSRTRINLKIQDGCDNFCSYCIIPHLRGAPVSRPMKDILSEFRELTEAGYREFLLTGVMIGNYVSGNESLESLAKELLSQPGDFRIHLSSISPRSITPGLIDLLGHERMVKHLSLSLQSGSDSVLKRMNRRYTRREYLDTVHSVRRLIPRFNFTTDIIVGFPGETEEDFRETMNTAREAGFSHIHIFRYSRRPGTPAASMGGAVPESTKTRRAAGLKELALRQKKEYYEGFNGMESVFLSERHRGGTASGFNEYYAPVSVNARLQAGRFFTVRTFLAESGDHLAGIPLSEQEKRAPEIGGI